MSLRNKWRVRLRLYGQPSGWACSIGRGEDQPVASDGVPPALDDPGALTGLGLDAPEAEPLRLRPTVAATCVTDDRLMETMTARIRRSSYGDRWEVRAYSNLCGLMSGQAPRCPSAC